MDITWKDIDLLELREQRGETIFIKPAECKDAATAEAKAVYAGQLRRHEDTYLTYKYEYGGMIYLFGWVTPHDELERAYSREIIEEWYDDIREGLSFSVNVIPDNPIRHTIVDDKFGAMNGGVYYFGNRKA